MSFWAVGIEVAMWARAMIKRADVTLGMNLGEGSGVCYTAEISGQEAICQEQ